MSDMNRRSFIKVMGGGAAALALSPLARGGEEAAARRPNVILVMTDDQGYGDLSCHGNPDLETPNLDALHEQSTRLTNFHVSPTCSPTRASLMTGRYDDRTGVWHTIKGRHWLRQDEVTMAEVFSHNGYRTGMFGKWHLGDNYPLRPQDRGFDEVLMCGGGGVGQTPDYWGNDYFDDTYFRNGEPEEFQGYCTDIWFENAMEFIERNRREPFFVFLPTNAPHFPFRAPDQYVEKYEKKGVSGRLARFYGMIENIDDNMGRLMRRLGELGLAEDTILIFTTDNGTGGAKLDEEGFVREGYNAGMHGRKGSPYEGGHRVPCFIRWPASLPAGRDVGNLTAHLDLLPTLMDMLRLYYPKQIAFDGTSLAPLLRGEGAEWPERILVVDSQRREMPEKWKKFAVMAPGWRLVGRDELYNVAEDPGQKNNVADQHRDVVRKLTRAYERYWESVSENFDRYPRVTLGSPRENPVNLTCHDWHGKGGAPWHQGAIRKAKSQNGFWAVAIAREGAYRISLRRWPPEVNKAINDPYEGKGINAATARVSIGDFDEQKPVPQDAVAVHFMAHLKPGKARLQTYFMNEKGNGPGAYYVRVERVD